MTAVLVLVLLLFLPSHVIGDVDALIVLMTGPATKEAPQLRGVSHALEVEALAVTVVFVPAHNLRM
jgi:hypothetical protein